MMYFNIVTLTLHNVTMTSQKPRKRNNKMKQTVINEVMFFNEISLWRYFIEKNNNIHFFFSANKTFGVIKVMDFYRNGSSCYSTIFLNVTSGQLN